MLLATLQRKKEHVFWVLGMYRMTETLYKLIRMNE